MHRYKCSGNLQSHESLIKHRNMIFKATYLKTK